VLSCGVRPLKHFSLLDSLRVWAALTGLLLVAAYFAALYLGVAGTTVTLMPMLIAAVGGFEMFLFAQDMWLKRRGSRG
jgi:hypothetical protein